MYAEWTKSRPRQWTQRRLEYCEEDYGPMNGAHPRGVTCNLDEVKYLPIAVPAAPTVAPTLPTYRDATMSEISVRA